jgi:hypothetical protein
LYDEYKNLHPEVVAKGPSSFLITGSPRYAASFDKSTDTQEMSLQAKHVSLRAFEYCHSFGGKVPQMTFQFDVSQMGIKSEILKSKYLSTFQSDQNGSALGGYSGGPVCVLGYDGFFLIGITKECKRFDDLYVIFASPITAIIEDISAKRFSR